MRHNRSSFFIGSLILLVAAAATGADYDFRKELECVHRADRRDLTAKPAAGEFVFFDGVPIVIGAAADSLAYRAARDFEDYLEVSMRVSAQVRLFSEDNARVPEVRGVLVRVTDEVKRGYEIETTAAGISIRAADERQAAQAFYHLEDVMNLRRGPFVKIGREVRKPVFDVRMTHSGYANDLFPEAHLNAMAHAGMTAIIIFTRDVDKTEGQGYQDMSAMIRLAKKYGLDTYLYSHIQAFAHPADPGTEEIFKNTYGRVAERYPEAKGIILVGESCQFPSKDPRVQPVQHWNRNPKDPRHCAGWFPCKDYPDWLRAVKGAIREKAPEMELVFWTYNWGWADEKERLRLIRDLPGDTVLMATFEMFERVKRRNGLEGPIADYSLSFAGPGRYFSSEATAAKARKMRLYTQANAGGLTWDFGVVPYQPCPYQWQARWAALVAANKNQGLSGVMENHHFGWWPGFISELEKEMFTEGGMPFDEHIRAIAVRDFGEQHAAAALEAWQAWSAAARDYVPTDENQYGPFRIGPAYPYNFGGRELTKKDFPAAPYAANGIGICRLNYLARGFVAELQKVSVDAKYTQREIELFEGMEAAFRHGADVFARIAASGRRPAAIRQARLGRYLARCLRTAINVKRGALAHAAGDREQVKEIAREEYANARAALELVKQDSRLGWEPSMDYGGGPRQIEWKLKLMQNLYGNDIIRATNPKKVHGNNK